MRALIRALRIATRKSPLALWQTEHVAARLRALDPARRIELVPLSTRGDEVLDRSLATIGGKGLFLKELELAMARNEADLAVHSLKDVPVELEPGFALAAILQREDAADAFISSRFASIEALPVGARVGTSSLRRQTQLKALRPDVHTIDLRGNVNTRLRKLDAGEYDAIILALAGIRRLGFESRMVARLAPPLWLPAAAQGAICIECRSDDTEMLQLAGALNDTPTATCVSAERALNARLGASCQVPVAAYATLSGGMLHLQALCGNAHSGQMLRATGNGPASDPAALGAALGGELLALGADALMR